MSYSIWVGEGEAPGDGYPPVSSGLACQWYPWNIRGCESAETWADVWNAWAERRSAAAAIAAHAARLSERDDDDDATVCVTPAGMAALDRMPFADRIRAILQARSGPWGI